MFFRIVPLHVSVIELDKGELVQLIPVSFKRCALNLS